MPGRSAGDELPPQLFHPLCGADPRTLLRLFTANGAIAPNRWPQAFILLAVNLLRWPFSGLERLWLAATDNGRRPVPAPLFIVGFWRSGTTHLHNILGKAPQFGHISPLAVGLPWDLLGLVRLLEPVLEKALPENRFVDNVAVKPDSPQEDSIALASMTPISYYHGVYFPRRFVEHFKRGVFFESCSQEEIQQWRRGLLAFLDKVTTHQRGKCLLVKNPVYTAHIDALRQIWPDAKFIHIYRNPYVVYPSTRHFFRSLLAELALQAYSHVPIEELILDAYPRMMSKWFDDATNLPATDYVETRFEDLEAHPLREIERIYATLELAAFDQARPHFGAYLTSIRDYRKNIYPPDPEAIRSVQRHWGPFLQHWGYDAPAP
jgi:hypothetical protein